MINNKMTTFESEITSGKRFMFGKNWKSFSSSINEEVISHAERSLIEMIGKENLNGKSFLDIGSGSGLMSLAALRLGASVYSFDYDPMSMECTKALKSNYFPYNDTWTISQGSILDKSFLATIGMYDIVYSWGVLHHTGKMNEAIDNTRKLVKPGGILFIALYNDQGFISKLWKYVKIFYCSGRVAKFITILLFIPYFYLKFVLYCTIKRINIFNEYKNNRGMSIIHDWIDWLGGYPFEVAKPEDIINKMSDEGFILKKLTLTKGLGNNQFIFINSQL